MLYREIIAVCSEIHTKHLQTLYRQNVGLLTVGTLWYIQQPVGYKRLLHTQNYIYHFHLYFITHSP